LESAKQAGFEKIKINVVLIKGFNDDEIEQFVEKTQYNDIDIRLLSLCRLREQYEFAGNGFMSADEVLIRCPDLMELDRAERSSPAKIL
jgi:cyclic pyranopterin phosphate synthase